MAMHRGIGCDSIFQMRKIAVAESVSAVAVNSANYAEGRPMASTTINGIIWKFVVYQNAIVVTRNDEEKLRLPFSS